MTSERILVLSLSHQITKLVIIRSRMIFRVQALARNVNVIFRKVISNGTIKVKNKKLTVIEDVEKSLEELE